MSSPGVRRSPLFVKTEVEQTSHDAEEAKESQLQEQSDDDDFLACVQKVEAAGCLDTASAHLHNETDYISRNKYLGEPLLANE
jgi:hypothetical protein